LQYKTGDLIRYATTGVCQIAEIKKMRGADRHTVRTFYVLKPVSNKASTVYVPVDNAELVGKMRYILNKDEIDELIVSDLGSRVEWSDDRKIRQENFHSIIKNCDHRELLCLISCIYLKKQELVSIGKKLASTDEAILNQAEELIENEFSFVLGVTKNEVGAYIREKLGIERILD